MEKVVHALPTVGVHGDGFHLKISCFLRVLRTLNRIVRFRKQLIHSLLNAAAAEISFAARTLSRHGAYQFQPQHKCGRQVAREGQAQPGHLPQPIRLQDERFVKVSPGSTDSASRYVFT